MKFSVGEAKARLEIQGGHWWGLFDETSGVQTWAPVGKVDAEKSMEDVLSWYRLAYWYFKAGILDQITGPIVRCDDERVIEVTEMKRP